MRIFKRKEGIRPESITDIFDILYVQSQEKPNPEFFEEVSEEDFINSDCEMLAREGGVIYYGYR